MCGGGQGADSASTSQDGGIVTRLLFEAAAFSFVVVAGAACTGGRTSEPVGYINMQLTAPGPDGSTFRLPSGTELLLNGSAFSGFFSLDDDAASQTLAVPPGNYSVALIDGAGDTTVWPLTRDNADGTSDTVSAVLDLIPAITVAENQTTSLTIRFHVGQVQPVTFGRGSVYVSVEVDGSASVTSLRVVLSAPALSIQSADIGTTAPPELAPRLPGAGGMGDSYVATMQTIGSWSLLRPDTVCIQVTGSATAAGNSGFVNLVDEAPAPGSGTVCIQQLLPNFAFVETDFFRQGTASTPLLSDLSDRDFLISHGVIASINANLFDGTTLHLEALAGTRSASMLVNGAIFATIDTPSGPAFDSWYQLNEAGDGTVSLTPL
jgi:hypothetical protein